MSEVNKILEQTGVISLSDIKSCIQLSGDASSKEYYRIKFNDPTIDPQILLKFSTSFGPLVTGTKVRQDQSFIVIAKYLAANGIPVPKIYWHDFELGYALEQDLGNIRLANFLQAKFSPDQKFAEFSKAISLIKDLQALPSDPDCYIFQREIGLEHYLQESLRFIDYYLPETQISPDEVLVIKQTIEVLCEQVAQQKKTVIFRDLMAWNIMIKNGETYLVDFQDMTIGAYAYDLASLLTDRDTDFSLGISTVDKLIRLYMHQHELTESFIRDYDFCMMQRNFRLAGQFINLADNHNKPIYRKWVPGCLRRIARTLAKYQEFSASVELLAQHSPEFKAGVSSIN